MPQLIKMITDDDGSEYNNSYWHYIDPVEKGGCAVVLCTQEVFRIGDTGALSIQKTTKSGGCTCKECISIIKKYKSFKF